ncbi:MAG: carboxylate-amine ligase [Candidatus Marinimicrobia bacterium]|nr:carboxylate-amine ligase [Candidatus Neomarinimicrobiota bacterium]|tara:strand:- start:4868 stop:5992 length:1125 start_codon:yes stop_codon:yes gene_type:complete
MIKEISELNLGVEEEYQLINPKTRELTSYVTEILKEGSLVSKHDIKPELLQSQIEIGSQVCNNLFDLEKDLKHLRAIVKQYANKNNLDIIAAGTHPFSHWKNQIVTDNSRYHGFMDSTQYVGKRMLIFGMHVHIGIKDLDLKMDIMNQMRYFIPHIMGLSSSSPFWQGSETGFKSFRSIIFEDLPRTGVPEIFSSYQEYELYVKTLIKSNSIDDATKIWWDIRPHKSYPTLEFRMCDCVTNLKDALSIVALIQALVAKFIVLRKSNQTWRDYRSSLIHENKWRACQYGVNAKLIDLGADKEVLFKSLVYEMLDFIKDVVDDLGTNKYIENIENIVEKGTSADMQLKIFKKNQKIEDVVDFLIKETVRGVPVYEN